MKTFNEFLNENQFQTLNKKGEVRFDKQSHMFHKLDDSLQSGKHIYGVIVRK